MEVFFSYAHEDEALRDKLAKHLKLLVRQGVITAWYDRDITAGEEWKDAIDNHLESANIILLLVSSDFLASDYCYDIELKRALERHESNEARVIPVILRSVDWHGSTFGKLAALPKDGKAITSWQNEDEAFMDVVKGIRRVIDKFQVMQIDSPSFASKFRQSTEQHLELQYWLLNQAKLQGCPLVVTRESIKNHYNILDIGERDFEQVCDYINLLGDEKLAEVKSLGKNSSGSMGAVIEDITRKGYHLIDVFQEKNRNVQSPGTSQSSVVSQTNTGHSTGWQINVSGGTVNITPPNPQH
jgi:TIR domain